MLAAVAGVAAAAGFVAHRYGAAPGEVLRRLGAPGPANPRAREVTLYFADPRWTRLVPESRRISPGADAVDAIRALVGALIDGPAGEAAPVLPRGAELVGAYLGPEGLAVVDFAPEIASYDPGGASGEILTVFAVVHTLAENVPEVERVQWLVGGQVRETLWGHVKISEPLGPDPQWTAAR
ncbi:MAG: hypothetical protein Kow0092_09010 [Deferrisomatales bacterium]